jgi:hypothetical protein
MRRKNNPKSHLVEIAKIKENLLREFANFSEKDLQKMKELQKVVKKHVPEGVSLSNELISKRRKENV